MKNGLKHVVGKHIVTVVIATSERAPKQRVFLVFSDGTRFEIWGEEFSCRNGLDKATGIEEYVESGEGRIDRVYGGVEHLAPARRATTLADSEDGSLLEDLRRDLQAWHEVKRAIEKARA